MFLKEDDFKRKKSTCLIKCGIVTIFVKKQDLKEIFIFELKHK